MRMLAKKIRAASKIFEMMQMDTTIADAYLLHAYKNRESPYFLPALLEFAISVSSFNCM